MNQNDPRTELLAEGLVSYLDAKRAIATFEEVAGEIAKGAMVPYLEKLGRLTEQPNLLEHNVSVGPYDAKPSRVAVGALVNAPETWGIRWGLRWDTSGSVEQKTPMVSVAVRLGALYKRDKLLGTLRRNNDNPSVRIESKSEWPWEVHVCQPLPVQVSPDQLEETMASVVNAFLDLLDKARGLKAAING